jgi:hypothetical protein
MIDSAITVATEAEKLGLLGFLCLVVAVLVWVVRVVYKDREACTSARIEDANQRAKMNKELGEFKGKLEMMESLHIQALIRTKGDVD